MMQPRAQRRPKSDGYARRRLWPILAPVAILIVLALVWVWLWYYAATVADRTLAGWVDREAAAGRVYSCATQSIGGFPFDIAARCTDAGAEIRNIVPALAAKAKSIVFAAQVYRPTHLTGEIVGPLTLAESGHAPSFVATWTRARLSVSGVPPDPEATSAEIDGALVDSVSGADSAAETLFKARRAALQGRVVSGSARNHPVIEVTLHLAGAAAPSLHALLAGPADIELDAILRGFKDLAPKPLAERFREMQAAGGGIEIKLLHFVQGGTIVVGQGKLNLNEHGKLDGLVNVAIVGLEEIVPMLGVDQLIEQGIDRLSGTEGTAAQGMSVLDRLVPGLGGAIRESASASIVDTLKKMGEPTAIDNRPATVLPLRFADGSIYLGMLRIGELPPLF